jgi:endoglucanase
MRTIQLASIAVAIAILASPFLVCAQLQSDVAYQQVKRLGRGVNIIGYDPIWNDFAQGRFKEKHFRLLKDAGFQHVRINLHAFEHMQGADNQLPASWFKTLDWAVDNALKNNLMVILDLHNFIDMAKDPVGLKPKFLAFWRQVAPHYQKAPDSVIFEILNEPNGQLTPDMWNQYLVEALAIIRQSNPTRTVVIGPPFWNSIGHLDDLKLPESDRNIIVTVHYYLPMQFTHQGARWSPDNARLSGIRWGTDAEKQKVRDDFAGVQKWSEANRRPILLGEFGAYDKGEMQYRALYTAYVARTAESFGWAWSYWQFDSDFILYNIDEDHWTEPIKQALVP